MLLVMVEGCGVLLVKIAAELCWGFRVLFHGASLVQGTSRARADKAGNARQADALQAIALQAIGLQAIALQAIEDVQCST